MTLADPLPLPGPWFPGLQNGPVNSKAVKITIVYHSSHLVKVSGEFDGQTGQGGVVSAGGVKSVSKGKEAGPHHPVRAADGHRVLTLCQALSSLLHMHEVYFLSRIFNSI